MKRKKDRKQYFNEISIQDFIRGCERNRSKGTMKKINELLSDYFCEKHKINVNMAYTIEYADALELLTPYRLDLMPKIQWLEAYETGAAKDYAETYYRESIKAITGRTCKEGGKEDKKYSFDSFVEEFKILTEQIKNEGFDTERSVIPVDKNGVIMDGAHRTAIGIYFNLKVPIVRLDTSFEYPDILFLRNHLLDDVYIEQMVTDYLKMTGSHVYAVCLWPRAVDKDGKRSMTENLIYNSFNIIYRKEMILSDRALRYLIMQIYCGLEWMGEIETGFLGAKKKSDQCWTENSSAIFYFVEGPELEEVLKIKEEIRGIFRVGNHSVHITDNNEEAVSIANLVLNRNSLDLLEHGFPEKSKKLNLLIEKFKNQVSREHKKLDDFMIDASAVLGLYGLREIGDLDYVCIGEGLDNIDNVDNHLDYVRYYDVEKEELIRNPKYHLYFNGVKFITLEAVRAFKIKRGEEKDRIDAAMIDAFRKGQEGFGLKLQKIIYFLKRYCKFYWISFKIQVSKIKPIAKVYYLIKSKFRKN